MDNASVVHTLLYKTMKGALKFIIALVTACLIMWAFRYLAFTIYTVPYSGLEPDYKAGDRVMVNRWSYGLRVSDGTWFSYSRWIKSPVYPGDIVAFNNPVDTLHSISNRDVFIAYCTAVPGEKIMINNHYMTVPDRSASVRVEPWNIKLLCATYRLHEHRKAYIIKGQLYVNGMRTQYASFDNNYYWMTAIGNGNGRDSRSFGLVPESHIIGRACLLVYSKDPKASFFCGLRRDRWLQTIK
jgi:signal peptidase I